MSYLSSETRIQTEDAASSNRKTFIGLRQSFFKNSGNHNHLEISLSRDQSPKNQIYQDFNNLVNIYTPLSNNQSGKKRNNFSLMNSNLINPAKRIATEMDEKPTHNNDSFSQGNYQFDISVYRKEFQQSGPNVAPVRQARPLQPKHSVGNNNSIDKVSDQLLDLPVIIPTPQGRDSSIGKQFQSQQREILSLSPNHIPFNSGLRVQTINSESTTHQKQSSVAAVSSQLNQDETSVQNSYHYNNFLSSQNSNNNSHQNSGLNSVAASQSPKRFQVQVANLVTPQSNGRQFIFPSKKASQPMVSLHNNFAAPDLNNNSESGIQEVGQQYYNGSGGGNKPSPQNSNQNTGNQQQYILSKYGGNSNNSHHNNNNNSVSNNSNFFERNHSQNHNSVQKGSVASAAGHNQASVSQQKNNYIKNEYQNFQSEMEEKYNKVASKNQDYEKQAGERMREKQREKQREKENLQVYPDKRGSVPAGGDEEADHHSPFHKQNSFHNRKDFNNSRIQGAIESQRTSSNNTQQKNYEQNKHNSPHKDHEQDDKAETHEETNTIQKVSPKQYWDMSDQEWNTFGDRFPSSCDKKKLLGRGGFALVWLGENQKTQENFAIQQIVTNNAHQTHIKEIWFGSQFFEQGGKPQADFSHYRGINNLSKLMGYEIKSIDTWIFYELCGQSLGNALYQLQGEHTSTQRIYRIHYQPLYATIRKDLKIFKKIILELAHALLLLSDCKIVHSDLKTENILVKVKKSKDSELVVQEVKLIDYGSSFTFGNLKHFSMATPEYMAPEILNYILYQNQMRHLPKMLNYLQNYNKPYVIDVWSLGCVVLEMISGVPLWMSLKTIVTQQGVELIRYGLFAAQGRVFEAIIERQMQVIKNIDQYVDEENFSGIVIDDQIRYLLKRMLSIDPDQRISPQEIIDFLEQNPVKAGNTTTTNSNSFNINSITTQQNTVHSLGLFNTTEANTSVL